MLPRTLKHRIKAELSSSVSAAPVANLRLYGVPSSLSSWALHAKVFDNANSGSFSMQLCRTHSGGSPHPTKTLPLAWSTFRVRSYAYVGLAAIRFLVPDSLPNPYTHVAVGQILLSASISQPFRRV